MRGLTALGARDAAVFVLPLLSALEGLGIVALAVALVRRAAPADPLRSRARRPAAALPAGPSAHERDGERRHAAGAARPRPRCTGSRCATRRGGRHPLAEAAAVGLAVGPRAAHQAERRARDARRGVATHAVDGLRAASAVARAPARIAVLRARRRSPSAAGSTRACSSRPARSSRSPWGPTPACSSSRPASAALADYLRVPLATFSDPQLLQPGSAALRLGQHLRHGLVRWPPLLPAARERGRAPAGDADAAARAAADGGIRGWGSRAAPALAARRGRAGPAAPAAHRARRSRATRGSPGAIPSSRS